MVRLLAALVGIFFSGMLLYSFASGAISYVSEPPAPTAEHEFHLHPKDIAWSFDGPLGHYDKQQLQRGFQVYKEVCSACHSLKYVAFRDLKGIGYSDGQVKAIAASFDNIPSVNPDTGEPATRKGVPADRFPLAFANDIAARAANNNAIPPDLSYMTRARHGGADYVYSLLTGYQDQPAALLKEFPEAKTPTGLHFNPYFANLNIAMPPPLKSEGQVQYSDGTKPTVDNMARDVAAFLVWTADPNLETRHQYGFMAVIFLLFSSLLAFGAYRNIWRDVKH